MRAFSLFFAALVASALVGCGPAGTSGQETASCEENPERAFAPRSATGALALGGRRPEATMNGSTLNGIRLEGGRNGKFLNGAGLQGIELNGRHMNGTQMNGVANNGIINNGAEINGTKVHAVHLEGTELAGEIAGRGDVRGQAFAGAIVSGITTTGERIPLRIAHFERDANDSEIALYTLEHDGKNICSEGVRGVFVEGSWGEDGARSERGGIVSFSCTTGVIGKCVRWGYKPWRVGAELHQTCTRMTRADYCGNGVPYTKEGTEIDLYDGQGVQAPTGDATLLFEAGWGPDGAVCASRTRFEAKDTAGRAVAPSCWSALPTCDSWQSAQAQGAQLGNSSRAASRTFCE